MKFETLLVPFITGGIIVSLVKYFSTLKNTKLAAVIGGFPIGLFSIYFLTDQEAYGYGWDYGIITSILLLSVVVFNVLYKYFKVSKDISHIISLLTWFILATLRVYS
jgi:hypothetical protein